MIFRDTRKHLFVFFLLFFSTQQAPTPNSTPPFPQWEEADLEEQQLRQKLNKMADNISDQSESSEEEEEEEKPSGLSIRPASRSSIICSRLEEHQTDSEKVDGPHEPSAFYCKASFNVSKADMCCTSGLLVLTQWTPSLLDFGSNTSVHHESFSCNSFHI